MTEALTIIVVEAFEVRKRYAEALNSGNQALVFAEFDELKERLNASYEDAYEKITDGRSLERLPAHRRFHVLVLETIFKLSKRTLYLTELRAMQPFVTKSSPGLGTRFDVQECPKVLQNAFGQLNAG